MAKANKIAVDAWPKLLDGLNSHVGWLGCDATDVAKFLIIEGLERRRCEKVELKRAEYLAQAPRR